MKRRPVSFQCGDAHLCGMLDEPGHDAQSIGVLVVTGGPQYRAGSHRQFVELAARLADAGYVCLRFDHRGSGDSGGAQLAFDQLDDDIRAAVDCLLRECSAIDRVVIWGLCDAASAALIYAATDRRIDGLVLLNPWVRREQSEARARLEHYYAARWRDPAFWRRLLTGEVEVARAIKSFVRRLALARRRRGPDQGDFVDRMLAGAHAFEGAALLVLSGQDLTAQEFSQAAATGPWTQWLERDDVSVVEFSSANHTFSRQDWKDAVAERTVAWLDQRRR